MHKHHHCCKCPECYEVTRMAALRRMDPPSYGEWQHEQYGYGGYGSQTLPAPGGAAPAARGKAKLGPPARDPAALKPPPPAPGKSAAKVNGSGPGWWPECTCSSRDWYEQVRASPGQRLPGAGRDGAGGVTRGSPRVSGTPQHHPGGVANSRCGCRGWVPLSSLGLAVGAGGVGAAVVRAGCCGPAQEPSIGASLPGPNGARWILLGARWSSGAMCFWTPRLRCLAACDA